MAAQSHRLVFCGNVEVLQIGSVRNFRSSEDLDPYPATDAPTSPTPSTAKSRQSEWNARNLFTGWVNAPLTTAGEQAAIQAGQLLAQEGLWPDVVHTSVLRRTIRTADLVSRGVSSLTV